MISCPPTYCLGIEIDHELVAVNLAGVVEHGGQVDVLAGHGAAARVLDPRPGLEILEVAVAAREVGERLVVGARRVGRQPERALDLLGLDLALVQARRVVALVDLHLALPGEHDRLVALADVLARRRLHVDDAEVRAAGAGLDAEHARLDLDRVADVDRRAEAHVDVLEVGAGVLRDVLDGLAEGDQHDDAGGTHQPGVAVGARVAGVLRERVRGHRELGEGGEEALGDGLAALVPEHLPGHEVLQEVAGLLAKDALGSAHGSCLWAGESSSRSALR